jgi:pimeloyl-ACP methyl ester carboxylesterase
MKKYTKKTIYIIAIISFLTSIVALTNKIISIFSAIKNKLYNSSSYYYEWKFGKIHYIVKGEGKPILLVHSMKNGTSLYEYRNIINNLSKKYKVYAIDLIGYGNSEKPKITYTAYIYVQLIIDFIKIVINEPVDIITSGKSNSFTTMACNQNSKLFKKVIFINPEDINTLSKNPTKKDKLLKHIIESPILGTAIYNIISSKSNISNQFKKYVYNKNYIKTKYIEAFYESAHTGKSNSKYIYASNICKYTNVNIVPSLRALNNSIYIIQGYQRSNNFDRIINTYKEINPSIEGSTIDRTKEFPHIEKPDSILEVLSIYLH